MKTYQTKILKRGAIVLTKMFRNHCFIIFKGECVTEIIILLIDQTSIPTQLFCLDLQLKELGNIVNYCKREDWEDVSQG